MFDLTACDVERTPDQNYLISWRCSRPGERVAIYMSDDPERYYDALHPGSPVLYTTANECIKIFNSSAVIPAIGIQATAMPSSVSRSFIN